MVIFCPHPILGLVLFLLLPLLANALAVPPLRGRVNDLAGLLSAERARSLEEKLAEFERETGHQIALLTLPSLEEDSLEDFSIRVAEAWKIGQKGFDNGAILLIVRDDRKLRIEVGYGLEGVLPDAIASRIIRQVIVPHFRANDYAGGIAAGVDALLTVARGEKLPAMASRETSSPGTGSTVFLLLFLLLVFLGMGFLSLIGRMNDRRLRTPWSGRGYRSYGNWGGGFGGGGFRGGAGGFSGGGGGFGGGGASGSW